MENDPRDPETQQALRRYTSLLDAWNRRDADGFASLFTGSGSSVGFDGSQMNGREEIATTLRTIFADHATARYVASVREVRALGAGVVLVRAVVGMVPPGQSTLKPDVNAVQSVVVVTEGGRPAIALLHNTPAAFHGRPEAVKELTSELTDVLRQGRTVG